jgi:hypothetical protein
MKAGDYTKPREHVWTSVISDLITRRYRLVCGCSTYLHMARLPLQDSLGSCMCAVVSLDVVSSSGGVFKASCIAATTGLNMLQAHVKACYARTSLARTSHPHRMRRMPAEVNSCANVVQL